MNHTPVYRVALLVLALLACGTAPLSAQNMLLTEYKGKYLPVVRARDTRPFVEIEGKPVMTDGRRYALYGVPEYLPAFISVRDIEVGTFHVDMSGSEMNHEFRLRADFETAYWLDDVFIVLELDTDSSGKVLFLYEVGNLKPREPKSLSLRVPLTSGLGQGHYKIHLFSKGEEVLHSQIDPTFREAVVDRMTAKRIESIKDAAPKLLVGPAPEFPKALLKAGKSGHAVVSLRIGANGRVYDPTLKSTTDSAFGEAALAAVRMWRFLPQVRNGRPVETRADLPIDFDPPPETPKKS